VAHALTCDFNPQRPHTGAQKSWRTHSWRLASRLWTPDVVETAWAKLWGGLASREPNGIRLSRRSRRYWLGESSACQEHLL